MTDNLCPNCRQPLRFSRALFASFVPKPTEPLPLPPVAISSRRRIAYADPPYPGMAHYYPEKTEVDHNALLLELCEKYDAWALSTASTTLKQVLCLPNCPPDIRIGAWVKPFCSYKPNVNPAYAWEPVIFWNCRKRDRWDPTTRDWVAENITLQSSCIGAKPHGFCTWLFEMLGAAPDDEFVDIYPGSGNVTRAWQTWRANKLNRFDTLPLFAPAPVPATQPRLLEAT